MAPTALVLDLVFLGAGFGARSWLQWRRTGDAGWRLGRAHSPAEFLARLFLVGAGALLGASVAAGWDTGTSPRSLAGVAIAATGVLVVVVAQLQMGASWRIGVDRGERTELVRAGLYGSVRNPIYTGMALFAIGQLMIVPNAWSAAAVVLMITGVEIQVRRVEEPFLLATHGARFQHWAAVAGRFAPGIGRRR
jgi:protein-S-isoprenylcysteine O-methyltransferase Ste14